MDQGEREVLASVAPHRMVLAEQLFVHLAIPADQLAQRLDWLVECGWLVRVRLLPGAAPCFSITEAGLSEIDSDLLAPEQDLGGVRRGLGAAWAWVRAQDGRFAGATVLTARELVAHDTALRGRGDPRLGSERPFGVRIGGVPAVNASGLHHPDLLLIFHDGWVCVHIQLGSSEPRRLAAMLTAYGADERFRLLAFLVEEERVAGGIEQAAARLGVSKLVSVQWNYFN